MSGPEYLKAGINSPIIRKNGGISGDSPASTSFAAGSIFNNQTSSQGGMFDLDYTFANPSQAAETSEPAQTVTPPVVQKKTVEENGVVYEYEYIDDKNYTETSLKDGIKTVIRLEDGNVVFRSASSFDSSGKLKESCDIFPDGRIVTTSYGEDGRRYVSEQRSDGSVAETLYDSEDKRILASVRDTEGNERVAKYDGKGYTLVTVQNNETPSQLARSFNMTSAELFAANKGNVHGSKTNPYFLAGQEVRVVGEYEPDSEQLSNRDSSEVAQAKYKYYTVLQAAQEQARIQDELKVKNEQEKLEIFEIKEKRTKEGKDIADVFYKKITQKTIGSIGSQEFQTALKNVNSDNVVEVVRAYQELTKDDETLLEGIDNEITSTDYTKSGVKSVITDSLMNRAKKAGVSDDIITKFIAEVDGGLDNDSDLARSTLYALVATVENNEKLTSQEKELIKNTDFATQRGIVETSLTYQGDMAEEMLHNQLASDGWAGKTVDWMGATLWDSKNTEEKVKADIEEYSQNIEALKNCKTEAEFKAKFKEIYGIEHDPVQIASFEQTKSKYLDAQKAYTLESAVNNKLSHLLNIKTLSGEGHTVGTSITGATQSNVLNKEDVYNRELTNLAEVIGGGDKDKGLKFIEAEMKSKGLSANASMEDKYGVLRSVAETVSDNLHILTTNATGGKSIESVKNEYDNSFKAAYGTKNDIMKRVNDYCDSQEVGATVLKEGLKVAGAVAVTALTAGAGAPSMLAILGTATAKAGFSAIIDISDRISSKNGMTEEELNKYVTNFMTDTVTETFTCGFAGYLHSKPVDRVTSYAVRTAFETGVGTAGTFVKNGEVSLSDVAQLAVVSLAGQYFENVVTDRTLTKSAQATGIDESIGEVTDNLPEATLVKESEVLSTESEKINNLLMINGDELDNLSYDDLLDRIATVDGNRSVKLLSENDILESMSPKAEWGNPKKISYTVADSYERGIFGNSAVATNHGVVNPVAPVSVDDAQFQTAMKQIGTQVDTQTLKLRNYDVSGSIRDARSVSGTETNRWWQKNMGYDSAPYVPEKNARIVVLNKETTFVRTFDVDGSGAFGNWIMAKTDLMNPDGTMMSPVQIKDKFALPQAPKFVCDVTLPEGTILRTGTVNPLEGWGSGGGTQFDLMGQRVGRFDNPTCLPGVGEAIDALKKSDAANRELLKQGVWILQ